jgi:hypothetical protein
MLQGLCMAAKILVQSAAARVSVIIDLAAPAATPPLNKSSCVGLAARSATSVRGIASEYRHSNDRIVPPEIPPAKSRCRWTRVNAPGTRLNQNPLRDNGFRMTHRQRWSRLDAGERVGGGARRDRTADLLHAMQALSQLSYGPTGGRRRYVSPARLSRRSTSQSLIHASERTVSAQ